MAMQKSKVELKRVNINLPIDLVNRVTEYSEEMGINLTSAYVILLNNGLDQKETFKFIPQFLEFFQEVAQLQNQKEDNKK